MAGENAATVVAVIEATNRRDFGAAVDAFADEVELGIHGELSAAAGSGAVGKAAVVAWFSDWFRMFESDYRFDIQEAQEHGELVFLVATHHARGRGSGATVEMPSAWIYRLRDGKLVRLDGYTDPDRARADLRARVSALGGRAGE